MTLIESYALDISRLMRQAADADKAGDIEKALTYIEEVKRIHHLCYSDVWHSYHESGTVRQRDKSLETPRN